MMPGDDFDASSKAHLKNINFTPKLINQYVSQRSNWDDISNRIQSKFKKKKSRTNMIPTISQQSFNPKSSRGMFESINCGESTSGFNDVWQVNQELLMSESRLKFE